MEFKLDKKEIVAIAIVFFAVLGLLHYPLRTTLPEFSEAIKIQGAMSGKAAPVHSQLAAQLVPAFASLAGMPANSPDAIVGLLLELSPLLLAITSAIVYATLRQLSFSRTISAFIALLISFLLSFQFLPGIYGGAQAAAPLFALFLLGMAIYSKGSLPAIFLSALFAALSAFIFPSYAAAGIAVCLSFASAKFSSKDKAISESAAILLLPLGAFVVAALVSPAAFAAPSVENIPVFFSHYSLLLAFCALSAAVFLFVPSTGPGQIIMVLFGILASAASPLCAVFALAIPSSYGLQAALKESLPKNAKLLCAFFFGFFAVFSLTYSGGDALRAAVVSFMVAVLFPLIMHFYDYQGGKMFALFSLAALLLPVFLLAISQFSPGGARHIKYADSGFSSALSSVSKSAAPGTQVYLIGDETMARFYLQSATLGNQSDLSSFLATGKPALARGSTMLFSPAYFDSGDWNMEGRAFIAYRFNSNITAKDGSKYAIFASSSGGGVLRQLDSEGNFALRDGSLLDSSGRQYSTIPFSRMVMLQNSLPHFSGANRLLVLEEGAKPPYALDVCSGKADGVPLTGMFGQVAIYGVE